MASCIYQGGEGYRIWVPDVSVSTMCHAVVHPDKYLRAQPTQEERDAFYAVHGREMEVTKGKHTETWGN